MQSFCLAECVVSDLKFGLYSQRQINFQSPCSPILACFILDLLCVFIEPPGALCRHMRWSLGCLVFLGHLVQRRWGGGGRSHCICISLFHRVKRAGIFVIPVNSGVPQHPSQNQMVSLQILHLCIIVLHLWKLLCGLLLFIPLEFICLFLDISNHYPVNIKAFHNSGKAKNEIEGKMIILRAAVSEL